MLTDVRRVKLKFGVLSYWLLISIAVLAPLDQYQRDIILGMSLQRIIFIFLSGLFLILLFVENRNIYFSPLAFPLFLYFIAQLVGAYHGEQSAAVRAVMRTFGYIMLFFVAANLPKNRKQILSVLVFFMISLFCVEILAVFKILTGKSLMGLDLIELKRQHIGLEKIYRMRGTSKNPNQFASLFTFALPISMCLSFAYRSFWTRFFLLLFFFLGLICLLATQSKSATLGVSVGLLVAMVYLYLLQERRMGKIIVLLALSCPLIIVTAFNHVTNLKNINITARVMDKKYYGFQKNNKRIQIWKESSKYILAHPFGAGTGKSAEKISEHSDEIEKARSSHNVFLSAGTQCGWLGIVSVFSIFALVFYHLGVGVRRAVLRFDKVLILGFFSSFVASFIHNQFHSLLGWNLVWLILGLAFATLRISKPVFHEAIG